MRFLLADHFNTIRTNICNTRNDWGITNKIVRIGTDIGLNMIKAFSQIDELLDLDERNF